LSARKATAAHCINTAKKGKLHIGKSYTQGVAKLLQKIIMQTAPSFGGLRFKACFFFGETGFFFSWWLIDVFVKRFCAVSDV
jgi:hypothetical protein